MGLTRRDALRIGAAAALAPAVTAVPKSLELLRSAFVG
jgi:hypothetical protein